MAVLAIAMVKSKEVGSAFVAITQLTADVFSVMAIRHKHGYGKVLNPYLYALCNNQKKGILEREKF